MHDNNVTSPRRSGVKACELKGKVSHSLEKLGCEIRLAGRVSVLRYSKWTASLVQRRCLGHGCVGLFWLVESESPMNWRPISHMLQIASFKTQDKEH